MGDNTEGDMYDFDDDFEDFDEEVQDPIMQGETAQSLAQPVSVAIPAPSGQPLLPPGTAARLAGEPARPMTAVVGAGFSSKPQVAFDPLNQATRGPAPALQKKTDNSVEEQAREMEEEVKALVDTSAQLHQKGELNQSLEKAKEAGRKERLLMKFRQKNGIAEGVTMDAQFSVYFNLAYVYETLGMFTEALNTYSLIVKNKAYPLSGRMRVNMGNIYFKQKKYPQAIKMYRMALDQVPPTCQQMRLKIMRNIGHTFVKLGQLQDAISSYETVVDSSTDVNSGFALIICFYALADREKMKKAFLKLVSVQPFVGGGPTDENEDEEEEEVSSDTLKQFIKKGNAEIRDRIMSAAKLIAPIIEDDFVKGYDWVIDQISNSPHKVMVNELEISKALTHLKRKDFKEAITTFKAFEKRDQALQAAASTNLSFLYFLEGDLAAANKHSSAANRANRYNPNAVVNKGNCLLARGDLDRAAEHYVTAISLEPDCTEAIYNLGLVEKRRGDLPRALSTFQKLHRMHSDNPEVVFQLANISQRLGDNQQALEWLNILITMIPTDAHVLARLGQIYESENDQAMAFQYYMESYRYYPVDMDVISWLGAYYVRNHIYEKAIQFFKRASEIVTGDPKYQLMAATCYRRMGSYQQALDIYKVIHAQFPENVECLRYLVRVCTDIGLKDEVHEYVTKLRKVERLADAQNTSDFDSTIDSTFTEQQHTTPQQAETSYEAEDQTDYSMPATTRTQQSVPSGPVKQESAFDNESPDRKGPSLGNQVPDFQHLDNTPQGKTVTAKARVTQEEDDWGDEDVDALLPE